MINKSEKNLLLFIITLGIFLLFFINILLEPKILTITEILNQEVETKIKIFGEIKKITTNENITIINIKDETNSIKVILFEEIKNLFIQDIIIVEGIIIEYRGEVEINAEKITKITPL